MADVRITVAVALVLRQFLADPGQPRHGYELMQLTGFLPRASCIHFLRGCIEPDC